MRRIDPARDLAQILRSVEKPARYVGGEYGCITKSSASLRVAISFPDLYEIGMCNAAVRILYAILNSLPGVACERVFAPAPDFEAKLHESAVPLYSLETGTALSDFHVIGFSIGYELTITNALAILETGGVSLDPSSRGANEPIVIVGGPAASNPVPFGAFADCVFIGEAEGWAQHAFSALARLKETGAGREDLLSFLRAEPSVWHPGKKQTVRRALWRGFGTHVAQAAFPVPSMRVVQDHGTIEIMRGCPNACKFCQATVYYRACRLKHRELIEREAEQLVVAAGYRQITLSSLSSGDYKGLFDLVRELNARYSPFAVSFSLPSLRVDSLALQLLREISEVRKSGLTFAVETAREEWQKELRKKAGLDKIVSILRESRSLGWKAAKFYFMVGLPASFNEDESSSIVEFLQAVRAATGMSINVNVAGFIPKPHTLYERSEQIGEESALERIRAVKDGLGGNGFKVGYHAPFLSILEGIFSRGDHRAGLLAVEAYRRGARLDAWEEYVNTDLWRAVIAEAGWDVIAETCRARGPEEKLPWDGVALGLSSSEIADDPPDERQFPPRVALPLALRPETSPWTRLVFSFSKEERACYISHLDLMTVMERSIGRAGYQARFTEGFNPKPRLEFASPLGLGISSRDEVAGVDLFGFDSPQAFIARLNGVLPPGLSVTRAEASSRDPGAKRKSLMAAYWGSEYSVKTGVSEERRLTLPGSGPSIRAALQSEGLWGAADVRRLRTLAQGPGGEPVSYFDAFCPPSAASSDLI